MDKRYRDQVRTLQAVDEAVGAILDEAARAVGSLARHLSLLLRPTTAGRLASTGSAAPKGSPYEESLRMMLLYQRTWALRRARQIDQFAAQCRSRAHDPRSRRGRAAGRGGCADPWQPLLRDLPPASWRQSLGIAFRKQSWSSWPSWRGVRTDRYTYVEYEGGDQRALRQPCRSLSGHEPPRSCPGHDRRPSRPHRRSCRLRRHGLPRDREQAHTLRLAWPGNMLNPGALRGDGDTGPG